MSIFNFWRKKPEQVEQIETRNAEQIETRNWEITKQLRATRISVDAGVKVSEDTASSSAVWSACVKVLSEDISSLPFQVYERLNTGDKRTAREHPVYKLLHDSPNDWMPANVFRKVLTRHVLTYGNAYAYIKKQGSVPVRLQPLHPTKVTPTVDKQGNLLYLISIEEGKKPKPVSPEFILHLMGASDNGIVGLSPVEEAAQQLGISLAADKLAASLYAGGSLLNGILVHPGELSQEAEDRLAQSWREAYSGVGNANKIAILAEGMTFTPTSIPPEQAQFLESRRFQGEEQARLFRMPPHKIGILDHATFSNIEHQQIDYVQSTLFNWLVTWEQECNRKLFREDEKETYFAEHKVDAFMRGDQSSRYAAHAVAIQWGWQTPKRVAAIENLPTDGLSDTPLTPLNMQPVTLSMSQAQAQQSNEQNALVQKPDVAPFVLDAAKRLLTKESKAYQRAAKKYEGDELAAWVSDFYSKHKATILSTYAPVIDAICPQDKKQVALDTVTAKHSASSERALMDGGIDATLPTLATKISNQILEVLNEQFGKA